jgi:hypothetical protein
MFTKFQHLEQSLCFIIKITLCPHFMPHKWRTPLYSKHKARDCPHTFHHYCTWCPLSTSHASPDCWDGSHSISLPVIVLDSCPIPGPHLQGEGVTLRLELVLERSQWGNASIASRKEQILGTKFI